MLSFRRVTHQNLNNVVFREGLRVVGRLPVPLHGLSVPGVREPRAGVVGGTGASPRHAAASVPRSPLQVLVLRAHQHRQRLVSVRGPQVRQLSHSSSYGNH